MSWLSKILWLDLLEICWLDLLETWRYDLKLTCDVHVCDLLPPLPEAEPRKKNVSRTHVPKDTGSWRFGFEATILRISTISRASSKVILFSIFFLIATKFEAPTWHRWPMLNCEKSDGGFFFFIMRGQITAAKVDEFHQSKTVISHRRFHFR